MFSVGIKGVFDASIHVAADSMVEAIGIVQAKPTYALLKQAFAAGMKSGFNDYSATVGSVWIVE